MRYAAARDVDAKGLGSIAATPAESVATAVPEQVRGVAGLRAPLVGRDEELRVLVDAYRRIGGDRRAYLVTIFGPAGSGKSRLRAVASPSQRSDDRCSAFKPALSLSGG